MYDRVEYWQRKRDRWRAEKETAAASNDAFASGGLFAGFGQHQSPRPHFQQQQQLLGGREQHGRTQYDDRSVVYGGRTALRPPPPPLFPSISSSHRSAPPQPQPSYATSAFLAYPSSQPSHLSPLSSSPPPSYMSGVHELHGGPGADEQHRKREAQRAYQLSLQQQMKDKEERLKREKRETEERDRREEEEARNYNPFGRGGGGAPMRDEHGHILANRTQALAQALSPSHNSGGSSNNNNNNNGGRGSMPVTASSYSVQWPAQQTVGGYVQPVPAGRGRVGQRSDDSGMAARREEDRHEWQQSLAQQIEEKASKKRAEEERRRDEDRREEERLLKERSRMDDEWRRDREKEQQKQRAVQEEQEQKARKANGDAGLTDYEREQAMKGRRVQQPPTQQPQREEERKETMLVPPAQSLAAAGPPSQYSAPRAAVAARGGLPFTYDDLERDMERLRADVRQQSDKARERRSEKQQQHWQYGGRQAHEAGRARRRPRMAALDEDDDTNIARFLNKQHSSWGPQAFSSRWHDNDDGSVDAENDGLTELDAEMNSGGRLAGSSTFVPLPSNYDSRVGTPEGQPQRPTEQRRQQHQPQQQQQRAVQTVHEHVARIDDLPPPPPPPTMPAARLPPPADERPLPALAKQSKQAKAAPTTGRLAQHDDGQAQQQDREEELYADDEFVVEDAQPTSDDEQYNEDELPAETDEQQMAEEEEYADEGFELHEPSEYSKLVSDVDLREDDLERFVMSEVDNDQSHASVTQKRNGRKKWSAQSPKAVQATA